MTEEKSPEYMFGMGSFKFAKMSELLAKIGDREPFTKPLAVIKDDVQITSFTFSYEKNPPGFGKSPRFVISANPMQMSTYLKAMVPLSIKTELPKFQLVGSSAKTLGGGSNQNYHGYLKLGDIK